MRARLVCVTAATILTLTAFGQTTGVGDNMLTAAEREAGFRLLFDGETLDGWQSGDEHWSVEDGMLVGRNDGSLESSIYLYSEETFDDFVLRATCRLEGGNSGIQYRTTPDPNIGPVGYQVDMSDAREVGAASWWGSLYEAGGGRGVMVNAWAITEPIINRGGWNDVEVICQGDRIIQRINGVTTVDIEDDAYSEGHFAIQLHQGPAMAAFFKNLRVRPLEPGDDIPPAIPGVPAGWTPLFTGEDLSSFDVVGEEGAFALTDNGEIGSAVDEAESWLRSKEQYADLVLHVECRASEDAESAVLFRADDATGSTATIGAGVEPETWHTYEIHCVDSRITVIVGDTRTRDELLRDALPVGHVGLLAAKGEDGGWVELRNIWIKEIEEPGGQ
ncbi:MAG: DUF1080 domain-containing protein [Armatimonadia bacterium]|nr:DUF1080 domain-containing protein [Armatimonadia bacterium]